MKILHTADLHLGKNVNGFSLIEDQRYILAQVAKLAAKHEVDALFLAGDLYDKTTPSAEAVALLDWFLTLVHEQGIEVFAIPGNHDSAERVAYASGILESHGVHIPETYAGEVKEHRLTDEFGEISVYLLPFLKPVHVRPHFPDEDINQDYSLAIKAALSTCPIDERRRNLILSHQFVMSGSSTPLTCDSELNVGGLDSVDASVFDAFDYVALGHIHRAQHTGREEIRYAGSPLKYSFSEIDHVKSVTLVELREKGCVNVELVELKPLRDLRCIRGPLDMLCSDDIVNSQNASDYLRVILTDETPQLNALGTLRACYPNIMSVEYDNALTRSLISEDQCEQVAPDEDPLELFERFFISQNGIELNEKQRALALAALNDAKAFTEEVSR